MEEIQCYYLLKQMKTALEQYERSDIEGSDITAGQCIVLNFLLCQESPNLYAKDIYQKFGISKATVSTILKSLKKKGYLIMEGDTLDDRKKRIVLTEKAYGMRREVKELLQKRGEDLCRGISGQELQSTEQILCRMISNLKRSNRRD